jgi:hypothetical protein
MRIPAVALSLLALVAPAACTTGVDTTYTCVSMTPDADAGADDLLCNVAWSCNNDTTHYGLQCRFFAGNYACSCILEGNTAEPVKTFSVAPFDCLNDPASALPAVTTGCGWALQLQ